jgi:hypothetical protein
MFIVLYLLYINFAKFVTLVRVSRVHIFPRAIKIGQKHSYALKFKHAVDNLDLLNNAIFFYLIVLQ